MLYKVSRLLTDFLAVFRIRIHFRLNTDPGSDPIWIQSGSRGFLWPKFEEKNLQLNKNLSCFWSTTAIYLSLEHHKEGPSNRKSLQPSKENIYPQPFKTWKFLTFFHFCGSFLPFWIRIRWPDWIRIQPDPTLLFIWQKKRQGNALRWRQLLLIWFRKKLFSAKFACICSLMILIIANILTTAC